MKPRQRSIEGFIEEPINFGRFWSRTGKNKFEREIWENNALMDLDDRVEDYCECSK
jgi:hypothetical protein